jgi:hypothetical protein
MHQLIGGIRVLMCAVLIGILGACGSQPYRETAVSKLSGALDVRWIRNDYFLFLPNKDNPLTLQRADGSFIRPGPMYTDGGSIPRFLWGVEGLSPWGYAPAYVMHDWLFEAKHCNHEPDNHYSFADSVSVMAESLKAVMEADIHVRNYFLFDSIVGAVGTSMAKGIWERGTCDRPGMDIRALPGEADMGELITTIQF